MPKKKRKWKCTAKPTCRITENQIKQADMWTRTPSFSHHGAVVVLPRPRTVGVGSTNGCYPLRWKSTNGCKPLRVKRKLLWNWVGATRGGSKFRQPLAKPAPEKLETKKGHTNKDSFPNLFVKKFQVNAFVLQPTMYISPTVSCNREDNSALLFC